MKFYLKNHTDIIGGQEIWELDSSKIYVPGYNGLANPGRALKVREEGWGRVFGK